MQIKLSNHIVETKDLKDVLGLRGTEFYDLNSINVPIASCYIFTAADFKNLKQLDIRKKIKDAVEFIKNNSGKNNSEDQLLILKVLPSPSIFIDDFQSMHSVGLNLKTIFELAEQTGEDFAKNELIMFYSNYMQRYGKKSIDEVDISNLYKKKLKSVVLDLEQQCFDIPSDLETQIENILIKMWDAYYADPTNEDIDCGIIIQEMFFGNTPGGKSGYFNTRNTISGDNHIIGKYSNESFECKQAEFDINKLHDYKIEFKEIARNLEKFFKEIKYVEFIIEKEKLCIIGCRTEQNSSTSAQLRVMLDLTEQSVIDEKELILSFKPKQLNDLLHPIVDQKSATKLKKIQCGIAGSPGAATGRIFFNTTKLMEEFRDCTVANLDTKLILAIKSTYANDVQAIEFGQGVISSEGGYASHAPVVARSLGKPAMVIPDITFKEDHIILPTGERINEGDYISIEVPTFADPNIYLEKVDLVYPNFEENGLNEFISYTKKYRGNFQVRCNADNSNDAQVGKNLGAIGIGLCRTEHMFFAQDRILAFRHMLITSDQQKRKEILQQLEKFQKKDFLALFEVMANQEMTIRLLDAPLHEFIPATEEDKKQTIEYLLSQDPKLTKDEVELKFSRLYEVNPMLGHRGCRLAISNPDIYEMQISAIFEAAYESTKKGIEVYPEIMVPIVMSDEELKFIKNGRDIEGEVIRGIVGVIDNFKKQLEIESFDFNYKIGTMIELPAAALSAAHLSKHAEFFSFGTNDLTQTTHGLSRDDINSFLPSYTQYDIMRNNPFQVLTAPVRELIQFAVKLGKMVRPDIKLGLCGEHGCDPENIKFCMDVGLDYVSCSPYGVPVASLSIAQNILEQENNN